MPGLFVNSKIWDHLANLPVLLSSFQSQIKSLSTLTSSSAAKTSLSAASDHEKKEESLQDVVVKIMDDSVTSLASSKASKILANFGVMALNMAFMRMGYLELPDSTTDLENKLNTQFSNASSLLRKDRGAKGLQNPFYYSMFVTPFSLLVPVILSKESTSLEDMITICKELGNQYLPVLDRLQRDILTEVFRQSCGLQTSLESAQRLSEMWGDRDWGKELGDAAEYYKRRGPLGLLEGDIVGEVPDFWPVSDLIHKRMHQQIQSMNDNQTAHVVPNSSHSSSGLNGDPLPHSHLGETRQGFSTPPAVQTSIQSPPLDEAFQSSPSVNQSFSQASTTAEQQRSPSPTTLSISPNNPTVSANTLLSFSSSHAAVERHPSLPTTILLNIHDVALDVDPPISSSSNLSSTTERQPSVPPTTAPMNVNNLASEPDSPTPPIHNAGLSPVQQQPRSPTIVPPSPNSLLSSVDSPATRSPSPLPPPLISDDQSLLMNSTGQAANQAKESASRYPKRNRKEAATAPESLHAKPENKRPRPKRRKLFHASPDLEGVNIDAGIIDDIMELLSHEDGWRELDERIRVKQEELDVHFPLFVLTSRLQYIVHIPQSTMAEIQPQKFTDSLRNPYIAKFFDCDGKEYCWEAFFHSKSDFQAFCQFYEQVQADYVQDATNPESRLPRFLAHPKTSIFHIVTRKEFDRMLVQEVQKLLIDHCIVITDEDRPEIQFDLPGIEAVLGSTQKPTEIQDQSIRPRAGDFQHRIAIGTPEDLYKASIADHTSKKSLNALYFPDPNAGIERSSFSSDARAFLQTFGEPFCQSLAMPVADLRFSLCYARKALSVIIIERPKYRLGNDYNGLVLGDEDDDT